MSVKKGMIVLMGSGEFTSTMVEVHKEILRKTGSSPNAVFLDTPAGFQLNADQLSQRAVDYFRTRIQHPLSVASFKSKDIPPLEAEEAFVTLRKADYILMGPGSPTYAVRNWQDTLIPEIIAERIRQGGCFVAASAAALTVGSLTLPVYEIYKVGTDLHWVEGMNILHAFGLNYVVVPHWNNAEGGTHDTRCCFIGEARFNTLSALIPDDTGVIGLDEHTACIIDFEQDTVSVRGIGSVTIRKSGSEHIYKRDESFPLDILRGQQVQTDQKAEAPIKIHSEPSAVDQEGTFWKTVHDLEETFHRDLETDPRGATNAVLDLDSAIWSAEKDLENVEFISQARELLRELIVLLGSRLASSAGTREECLAPLVDRLVALRNEFRAKSKWQEADAVRDCLSQVNISIEDRDIGSQWHLGS